jgi:hypothetical protein
VWGLWEEQEPRRAAQQVGREEGDTEGVRSSSDRWHRRGEAWLKSTACDASVFEDSAW